MVAILNLLTLVTLATAAVVRRDAAQILTDLKQIDTDTNALTAAVNKWDGTTTNIGPVNSAEQKVESDLKSANTDAQNSAVASSSDANTIINYINTTLEPDVNKSLNAIVAKKSAIVANNLKTVVQNDLNNLKNETDTLGASLIAKTPSAQQSAAKSVLAKLDNDFAIAQKAFA